MASITPSNNKKKTHAWGHFWGHLTFSKSYWSSIHAGFHSLFDGHSATIFKGQPGAQPFIKSVEEMTARISGP